MSLERGLRAQQEGVGIRAEREWGQGLESVCIQGCDVVIYKKYVSLFVFQFLAAS